MRIVKLDKRYSLDSIEKFSAWFDYYHFFFIKWKLWHRCPFRCWKFRICNILSIWIYIYYRKNFHRFLADVPEIIRIFGFEQIIKSNKPSFLFRAQHWILSSFYFCSVKSLDRFSFPFCVSFFFTFSFQMFTLLSACILLSLFFLLFFTVIVSDENEKN